MDAQVSHKPNSLAQVNNLYVTTSSTMDWQVSSIVKLWHVHERKEKDNNLTVFDILSYQHLPYHLLFAIEYCCCYRWGDRTFINTSANQHQQPKTNRPNPQHTRQEDRPVDDSIYSLTRKERKKERKRYLFIPTDYLKRLIRYIHDIYTRWYPW